MALWQWLTLAALSIAGCIFAWLLLRSCAKLLDELDNYNERPYQ